jgi:deoxyribonuclease-4
MIGSHLQFNKNISSTLKNAISLNMQSVQFFMGGPQSFTRSQITDSDLKDSLETIHNTNINVFTHFPYVANLAGSKSCLVWNGDSAQDSKTTALLKNLEYELNTISKLKTSSNTVGVVIHPGNYTNTNDGLLAIAKSINKMKLSDNSMLLLENTAGGGTSLCGTLEEIKVILDNVSEKKNVGVCIDTCHLFAYGDYDISKTDEVDRFFDDFDKIIGLSYFKLLHLNDSKEKLKSRKDRHALIGTGNIWKDNCLDSLIYLMKKCQQYNICSVLETEPSDMEKMLILKNTHLNN